MSPDHTPPPCNSCGAPSVALQVINGRTERRCEADLVRGARTLTYGRTRARANRGWASLARTVTT